MLRSLTLGQKISDRFGVISVVEKKTANGDPYLMVELTHPSGTINGKVWSDAMPNVEVKAGGVAEIEASVDQYRGINNFNISRARQILDDELDKYLTEKPTMVFDIETVGVPFDDLDESQQDYLMNNLEKNFEGTKQQKKDRTGLYPVFAFVVAIGMFNPNSKQGAVYYLTDEKNKSDSKKVNKQKTASEEEEADAEFVYSGFEDEKSLLEGFWETAEKYERFVTYNGAGFDFPFLTFRSGVNRVKVPFETRGNADKFIDLAGKIKMNWRAFKLEQVCKAFGISNPKKPGVSGMEVARLYREGKLKEILKYVGRDVVSTSELFLIWKRYMAGKVVV